MLRCGPRRAPFPAQVPEMLRCGPSRAPFPVQVLEIPQVLRSRCRDRRCSRTGTSRVPAQMLVPEMLRRLTGAGFGKDASSPEGEQGRGWCFTIGKLNPMWGAIRGGHGLAARASSSSSIVPGLSQTSAPEGPGRPGPGELCLVPRGAAYMHLIARGRGN